MNTGAFERELGAEEAGERIDQLREGWREGMDEEIRFALERIGGKDHKLHRVGIPLIKENADQAERETFEWFRSNDKARVALEPLDPEKHSKEWPRLRYLEVRKDEKKR